MKKWLKSKLNNENLRIAFVSQQLKRLLPGTAILDAGCGSQQYRKFCNHLIYKAQDFGLYTADSTTGFTSSLGGAEGYKYGKLDYVGDIWSIAELDEAFDSILCTEVFEHIPLPNETLKEFSRLLKPGGKLILTLPSNCLRHMDPYYFYSGFSNNWITKFLSDNDFEAEITEVVGDYYSWIAVELARTMKNHSIFTSIAVAPAFIWFALKRPTHDSKNTLCMGYHVVATKLSTKSA